MVRDGRIADAKTIMLLHWAVLHGGPMNRAAAAGLPG